VTEIERTGKWQARYSFKGKKESKVFDTSAAAWAWLAEIQVKINNGTFIAKGNRSVKFEAVGQEWLNAHRGVTAGVKAEYRRIFENALVPVFGDEAAGEGGIDYHMIQSWISEELELGTGVETLRKRKMILSMVLQHCAVALRIRHDNPCSYIRLPGSQREEQVFLTHPEVLRLATAIGHPWSLAVRLAAYAGLRSGEMWDAKIKSLDPDKGILQIVSSVREVKGMGLVSRPAPKNGQWRAAQVPAALMRELVKLAGDRPGDELLFLSEEGCQVRHRNFYRRQYGPAIETSKIEQVPRFHDLRHTCAAFHFERGATGEEVRQILGHSNIATTHKHYAHIYPAAFARLVAGLDEEIAKAEAELRAKREGDDDGPTGVLAVVS
jgi:integrase